MIWFFRLISDVFKDASWFCLTVQHQRVLDSWILHHFVLFLKDIETQEGIRLQWFSELMNEDSKKEKEACDQPWGIANDIVRLRSLACHQKYYSHWRKLAAKWSDKQRRPLQLP